MERDLAVQRLEQAGLEAEVVEDASSEEERGKVTAQSPQEGTQVARGSTVQITVGTGPRQVEVPALRGLTYEEAVDALNEAGLQARRVNVFAQAPEGTVAGQSPRAGEQVDEGSEVEVRVSQGPEQVEVPDVLAQSESSARDELEAAEFEVTVTEAPSDSTPAGLVSAQSPGPGEQAPRGSTVQITISTGPELDTVPEVVGETSGDARAMIQDAGFRPRTVFQDTTDPLEDGNVLDQDPPGNSGARPGSTITIIVGRLVEP
jgi:serine/threonine-protein kinase